VSLAGDGSKDVPPVTLVFTGALNKAGEIAPVIDTAAIEAYLTMRRMQEDVERLETLDVSGRTPSPAEAEPEEITSAVPEEPSEPPEDSAAPSEHEPLEPSQPTAETESPSQAIPQSSPSAKALPSAVELLQEAWEKEIETVAPASTRPSDAMPTPPAAAPKAPAASSAAINEPEVPLAAPLAEPTPPVPSEAAASPEAQPTPAAVDVVKPRRRPASRVRRPSAPREAPDDWKKGIGIFGGG
jgi:hypothetical protein